MPGLKSQKSKVKSQNFLGFTLIELLITIAVMAIALVVAIPNLGKFNDDQSLTDTVASVTQAYRQVQTNAQSGVRCGVDNPATKWNLVLNTSGYEIKADCFSTTTPLYSLLTKAISDASLSFSCVDTSNNQVSTLTNPTITFGSITYGSSLIENYNSTLCATGTTFRIKFTSTKNNSFQCLKIDQGGNIYEESVCS